jgi:hypothetical protein
VAGCFDEAAELIVGYRELRDFERIELNFMHRTLTVGGIPARVFRSHQEPSRRDWHEQLT